MTATDHDSRPPMNRPLPDPEPTVTAAPPARTIRSFARRQGRITPAQSKALETLWPRYGLSAAGTLDSEACFGRSAPLILEIGFGNGDTLLEMAAHRPDCDFIGVEVHRPGIGRLLAGLAARGIDNVRVYEADAVAVLRDQLPDAALSAIHVFFPDPWPKARHHKRRLINPGFLRLVALKLRPGGVFHAATDWEDYARQMLLDLEQCTELVNTASGFSPRPDYRPETKFERRGRGLGHAVFDLIFSRRGD